MDLISLSTYEPSFTFFFMLFLMSKYPVTIFKFASIIRKCDVTEDALRHRPHTPHGFVILTGQKRDMI